MAQEVTVSRNDIVGGIKCCQRSVEMMESAMKNLEDKYHEAGSRGWQDEKYKDLGRLIYNCIDTTKKPIGELKKCEEQLKRLLAAVDNYEKIKL